MQETKPNPFLPQLWRSAGAILIGLLAVVVLSLATDQLLHVLNVYPPWGQPMNETSDNLLALTYRCVYGALGSYLARALCASQSDAARADFGRDRICVEPARRACRDPAEAGAVVVSHLAHYHGIALCVAGRSLASPAAHPAMSNFPGHSVKGMLTGTTSTKVSSDEEQTRND